MKFKKICESILESNEADLCYMDQFEWRDFFKGIATFGINKIGKDNYKLDDFIKNWNPLQTKISDLIQKDVETDVIVTRRTRKLSNKEKKE